jgi:endonuclease I
VLQYPSRILGKWALAPIVAQGLSLLAVLATCCTASEYDVVVNEMSQGGSGAAEWVELLVVSDELDMRGWELGDLDDGTWSPITGFRDVPAWSNVAAGTLIVIYNSGDVDGTIPGEDTDPAGHLLVLAHDNAAFFTDAPGGWPGGGVFGNGDRDDAAVLRDGTGQVVHDMAVTHPTATIPAPGSGQAKLFTGNTTGLLAVAAHWTNVAADAASPGTPNGDANATWINALRNSNLPEAGFVATSVTSSETMRSVSIGLSLSFPAAATVHVAVAEGSAVPGVDYSVSVTTIVFTAADATNGLHIDITNDTESEATEYLAIDIVGADGAVIAPLRSRATLWLGDDDTPTVFLTKTVTVVHEVGDHVDVEVQRWGRTNEALSVRFGTRPGDAQPGGDYGPTNGTLSFATGQAQNVIQVGILDDTKGETDESFSLTLHSPSAGTVLGAQSNTTITIIDDENVASNYYAGLFAYRDGALRAPLHNRIAGHATIPYDQGEIYMGQLDESPTNPSQVWLLYSREGRDKSAYGSGGNDQWNREHAWPKSHGFPDPDSVLTPSRDLHNLRAVDHDVNIIRAAKDFAAGGELILGMPPTCRVGASSFEPPDDAKGDVARMVFYMDVRYEGDVADEPDLQLEDAAGTSGARLGRLSELVSWHFLDPPDAFEQRRNDLIYRNWQGNRNPFIDHPGWVMHLWGPGIVTTASDGGTLSPRNPVVADGADQAFTIVPDTHFFIESVTTNGIPAAVKSADGPLAIVWSNIVAAGELDVRFGAHMVDGLAPLWWMLAHGLATNAGTTGLDGDGDGHPNWMEYVAGTDPTNGASVLRAVLATAGNRADLVLRWPSASNRTYAVQTAGTAGQTFTTNIPDIAATPPQNVHTTSVPRSEAGFYRIGVTGP